MKWIFVSGLAGALLVTSYCRSFADPTQVSVAPSEVQLEPGTADSGDDSSATTPDATQVMQLEGTVFTLGAVRHPRAIAIPQGGVVTVLEAVAASGGMSPDANGEEVRILRRSSDPRAARDVVTVDVRAMLESLDFSSDVLLRSRDIVFVQSSKDLPAAEYLVLGEVGEEGFRPWKEGVDVIRAITEAGGMSGDALLDSARLLRPNGEGQYQALPIDLKVLFGGGIQENRPVLPGDILYVPSRENVSPGQVDILGAVDRPGTADLPLNKSITLARMILLRGGGTETADLKQVRLIRTLPDGSQQELRCDIESILEYGRFEEDVPLQDQDVIIVKERGDEPSGVGGPPPEVKTE